MSAFVLEVQSMLMCVQTVMALVVAGAAQIKITYPQLGVMVSYTQSRQPALKQAAATARGSLDMSKPLPLQPKAYLALITFLRECRQQHTHDPKSVSQDYLGDDLSRLVCKYQVMLTMVTPASNRSPGWLQVVAPNLHLCKYELYEEASWYAHHALQ
jgi:hypothetical protein